MNGKREVVVGPNFLEHWYNYDYDRAESEKELQRKLDSINRHGYDLISVTQDSTDAYTLFFRRRVCG